MDSIWMAVGGFVGATLGTLVTGSFVESYRQKNRLQLAAIDKRLEAWQAGCQWIVELGTQVRAVQELENPEYSNYSDYEEQKQKERNDLQTMREEAIKWLTGHSLYLGGEISQMLVQAFRGDDLKKYRAALGAIEREAGLPSLSEDWPPFRFTKDRKKAT